MGIISYCLTATLVIIMFFGMSKVVWSMLLTIKMFCLLQNVFRYTSMKIMFSGGSINGLLSSFCQGNFLVEAMLGAHFCWCFVSEKLPCENERG